MLPVRIDRLRAEVQTSSDFAGRETVSDQLKYLHFAVAQRVEWERLRVTSLVADHPAQEFSLHAIAEVNLFAQNGADGRHDLFGRFLLHQITASTGPNRTLGVQILVV